MALTCIGEGSPYYSQFVSDLGSSEFKKREYAQGQLLEWGRLNRDTAKTEFYQLSQAAADPEVRERSLDILRSLIHDEYLQEGEGYIGIALAIKGETLDIKGEAKLRSVIRVVEVRPESPGERAGLQLNDLIVGIGADKWYEVDASPLFREKVRTMKPSSIADLTVFRNGEILQMKVTLGRRPLMADMLFNGTDSDQNAAERAAMEAYFRRWIAQKKALK